MNQNSNKSIEAVVDSIDYFEDPAPWEISKNGLFYIRLFSGTSDAEIGSIMMSAFSPIIDEIVKETAAETLRAFVGNEDRFVLSGGLLFKENNEIKVAPGCCGGLEDWTDWLDVVNGKVDIWTGHDPESFIEINDGKVKIWHDKREKATEKPIEFTVEEMFKKLQHVEKDLKDFLFRLGQWTKFLAPELEKQVVNHFAKNMNIEL